MIRWVAIRRLVAEKQWRQLAVWGGLLLWGVLLAGYFFSTQPWSGLYIDNQHTYFVQGLRLSGLHPYLENDWFAQTKPLHIAFTVLVMGLDRLHLLAPAVTVLDVFSRLIFLTGVGLMANALWQMAAGEKQQESAAWRAAFCLAVITIYLLSLWPVFQLSALFDSWGMPWIAKAWNKFGFYYSFGGFASFRYYVEPATFSMLIFPALALLPYRRWRWAAGLLGAAALFHASFLIHTGAIVGVLALYLFLHREKRAAWQVVLIYAVFVLPLVIYMLTQMADPYTAQANQILALNRVPHHTLPSRWWDTTEWVHTGVVLVALGVFSWRGRGPLRWILLATVAYMSAGIAYVALSGDMNIAILMPWRASGYLYTVAQLIVLTAGLFAVVKVLAHLHLSAGRWVLLFVPIALLVQSIAAYGLFRVLPGEYADSTTDPVYPFYQLVQNNTPEDAVFLIPTGQTGFRLGAQRAVYVDWKSHPYKGSQVLEWWQRIQFAQDFYQLEGAERQLACQDAAVDYYMLSASTRSEAEPIMLQWEDWVLIPCP